MREKTAHRFVILSLIFSFIVLVVFLFWWIFPYKTLVVTQPYKVLEKEVHQGEILQYEIEFCKYTKAQAIVRRQFIDGIIYAVPEITVNLKEGCGKTINTIEIPRNLPTGDYTLQIDVAYKMNPIRIITHELKTDSFTVVK